MQIKKLFFPVLVSIISIVLAGCNPIKDDEKESNKLIMTPCPHERPVMCPDIVEPACGVFSNGGVYQYQSKCLACMRHIVAGYIPGACPNK